MHLHARTLQTQIIYEEVIGTFTTIQTLCVEPYRPECNIEECNRGAEPFVLTDSTCAHVSFNYNYGM